MKYYIGLDLSLTASGIVILNENGSVFHSEVVGEKLKRDATVKEKIERMIYIAQKVIAACKMVTKEGNDLEIGIEGYAFSRIGAQNDLGELQGVIKSQVWLALKYAPTVVIASSARKVVFGKGNIPKVKILPELRNRGFSFVDSNDADAYVVAEFLRLKERGFGND